MTMTAPAWGIGLPPVIPGRPTNGAAAPLVAASVGHATSDAQMTRYATIGLGLLVVVDAWLILRVLDGNLA